MAVVNTLAYYNTELITAVKSFIIQTRAYFVSSSVTEKKYFFLTLPLGGVRY